MGYMILEPPRCNAGVVILTQVQVSTDYWLNREYYITEFLTMDRPCHIIKLHVGNSASNRKINIMCPCNF